MGCGGGAGSHFFFKKFFSYFPPLKPRCVLWSGASYSPKNTVMYEGGTLEITEFTSEVGTSDPEGSGGF